MKKVLLSFLLLWPFLFASGQLLIKGKVIGEKSREPLAFASIIVKSYNRGTTTDIDGKFVLNLSSNSAELIVSHIGYESRTVIVQQSNSNLIIRLREKTTELSEVVVRPEDNPAWRIIRTATKNKPLHDPENYSSFSYNSYNKLYSTLLDQDSSAVPDDVDSAQFRRYIRDNHLFIHESYTERKFLRPNRSKETVLGNHLSGVKDPFFAFLATDLQPFSFYKDFIKLFNKDYISPLSPGSVSRYDFILADTLYQGADSVYVITFEPLPGKVFDALKGQLYISTDGYAMQSVHAQPADDKVLVESLIQQKYEKINGKWFPVQLNSELRFKQFTFRNIKLKYVSHSYITNILIDVPIDEKDFAVANVEFAPKANRQDSTFWKDKRTGEFEKKEANTFHNLDSVGEKMVLFQAAFKGLEGLFVGKFRWRSFYIPIEHVLQLNQYEDVRLGIGLQTGEKISKVFSLEGNVGYGFGDQALKYGGAFQINIDPRREVALRISYKQDLLEPVKPNFIKSAIATRTQESLRNWMASRMDSIEQLKVSFDFRLGHGSQFSLFTQQQHRNPAYAYSFDSPKEVSSPTRFTTFETGVQWRFAPKETYMKIGQSQVVTAMTYPQINVSVIHSFAGVMDGNYEFTKVEARIDHQFNTRGLGRTLFQLTGGVMDSNMPYPFLFNGKGSRFESSFLNNWIVNNYFQTMGLYEFASDRYAYLFINHYVGRISGNKSKYFRPELSLIHNMGVGSLDNKSYHSGVIINTMEKGYFESGLQVVNLIRFNYLNFVYFGLGGGAFYRYGHYTFQDRSENLVAKFILTLSF
jgi:hypothetical protein